MCIHAFDEGAYTELALRVLDVSKGVARTSFSFACRLPCTRSLCGMKRPRIIVVLPRIMGQVTLVLQLHRDGPLRLLQLAQILLQDLARRVLRYLVDECDALRPFSLEMSLYANQYPPPRSRLYVATRDASHACMRWVKADGSGDDSSAGSRGTIYALRRHISQIKLWRGKQAHFGSSVACSFEYTPMMAQSPTSGCEPRMSSSSAGATADVGCISSISSGHEEERTYLGNPCT